VSPDDEDAFIGAVIVAEFMLRVTAFLKGK